MAIVGHWNMLGTGILTVLTEMLENTFHDQGFPGVKSSDQVRNSLLSNGTGE